MSNPRYVYRYLSSAEHADQMLEGKVWISTFEHIRTVDASRGDPHEGTLAFGERPISALSADERAGVEAQALAMGRPNIPGVEPRVRLLAKVRDAYMLCTSLKKHDKQLMRMFGEHCVRIEDPPKVLEAIAGALNLKAPVDRRICAPMTYRGRAIPEQTIAWQAPYLANIPSLSNEREFRFCWVPAQTTASIESVLVDLPELAPKMRRM